MAAVVRIKNGRFVRINLQHKDTRCFPFREISKPGVLCGYIKGVVQTAYPSFHHNHYGKMRKIILVETRDDDDDDDDDCLQFSIFTRGVVAEKCEEVKRGDFLLLENPFFELAHPQTSNLQIAGDKSCSDIRIWNINNKSTLLVGQEENECESIETAESTQVENDTRDQEDDCNEDVEVPISDGDVTLFMDQASSSHVKKGRAKYGAAKLSKSPKTAKTGSSSSSNDVAKSPRITRSSDAAKYPRHTRSSNVAKSPMLTRSSALKKYGPSQSQRVTSSTSSRRKDTRTVDSSQESRDSSASQSERRFTRSASRKTTDRITVSSPPTPKRGRKFHLGPKGPSNSPSDSPELRNVVALEALPRKSPGKAKPPQMQASSTKTAEKSSLLKSDEVSGSSGQCIVSSSSKFSSGSISTESSKENEDKEAREPMTNSQASSASQSGRHFTRSALRKTTNRNTVSSPPPPPKRRRKFHIEPKGISKSPSNSPKLRIVVALEALPRESPKKAKPSQLQASSTKTAEKSSPLKSDEISGSSGQCRAPSSSKSSSGSISTESSQENEDKEAGELMINSQASTPSGTFSSKKQKCFGDGDSSPGMSGKNLQLKSTKAVNATPTKIDKDQRNLAEGSPGKVNKNTRNSTQPNAAKRTAVAFVDNVNVSKKHGSPKDKQGKGTKHVVDKAGKPRQDSDAAVSQQSVNVLPTSNVTTSSTISNAPTISTVSFTVPSMTTTTTTTTSTDVPSTSTGSSIVPTTSTTSNVPPQSTSYTVPAPYTKISDVRLNTMCDLYGVAKFFKPPWKSRGTDMCSVAVLIDPSSDEPLECVMFKDVILLPQIRRVGDIVRLHRMNIKRYKDKLQAVSTRGFSALVFDGNVNSPVTKEAARVTTASFTFNEAEKKVVQDLKEWQLSRPDLFEEAKFLTVSMVEPDVYFDTVCLVKGMAKHTNIDCVVLRVTDGTEPKYEIKSCEDDDNYQVALAVDSHNQTPLFDVYLYGEHASLVMNLNIKADTVLMLHNVHSIATQGGPGSSLLDVLEPTLELCIHRGSEYGRGLAVLPPDSDDAQQLVTKLKHQGQISPRKQS